MSSTRKALSMFLALAMLMTAVGSIGFASAEAPDFTEGFVFNIVPAIAPDGSSPLWTSETTADGWVKITNPDGPTLGYDESTGVTILTVEGLAFKDLDKDGELDGYEDWRNSYELRAADLASQLTGEEMGPMTAHGGWGTFGETYPQDHEYVLRGGRGGVTRSNIGNGSTATAVSWTNSLQALCEKLPWGVPAFISVDPSEISGIINSLSMGATMDVDLAAQLGREVSKEYRAVGVSAFLGPQVDLTGVVMDRAGGTITEDPALNRDLVQAFVNGMQSTYDENGEDLGWGSDSVYCFTKHFAGAGASEGGRNDHNNPGRYSVFPGGNFEAHLLTYFDGAFNLPGKTKSAGAMMQYAINIVDGKPFGGEYSSAYNEGMTRLIEENWDGMTITDWGIITGPMADWGVEELTTSERIERLWVLGNDHLGLISDMDQIQDAYEFMVDDLGQEEADLVLRKCVYQFFRVEAKLGLFENPYLNKEYALASVWSESANAFGASTQEKAVVMLKNNGVIKAAEGGEKKTVYVPQVFTPESQGWGGVTPAKWAPAMNMDVLGAYFNVVTDTVNSGATVTENDVVRLTAEELANVDFIIMPMTAPYIGSAVKTDDQGVDTWYPASLQYAEYTAATARDTSIGGKKIIEMFNDGYTVQSREIKENRSYKGQTVGPNANIGQLQLLETLDASVGDKPIVVVMNASRSLVWSEVEPHADAILMIFGNRDAAVTKILAGELEPSALLPMQQPASMETVEAQLEDVPRDMEVYVDANGNAYDFAFGLNWSGVISDERVATYTVEPVTKVEMEGFHFPQL